MLFSNKSDFKICNSIIKKELTNKNLSFQEDILNDITKDIMNIIYAKGGAYSSDIIQSFTKTYIEEEFYRKYIDV